MSRRFPMMGRPIGPGGIFRLRYRLRIWRRKKKKIVVERNESRSSIVSSCWLCGYHIYVGLFIAHPMLYESVKVLFGPYVYGSMVSGNKLELEILKVLGFILDSMGFSKVVGFLVDCVPE